MQKELRYEEIADALDEYVRSHIDPEPELLHQVQRLTHLRLTYPRMCSGHLQGRLLKMLCQMVNAHRILELGTYSGYSALSMAEGLTPDPITGIEELHTIEVFDEIEDFLRDVMSRAGDLGKKIHLHFGDARQLITKISEELGVRSEEYSSPSKHSKSEELGVRSEEYLSSPKLTKSEELGVRSEEYSSSPKLTSDVANNSSLLTPNSSLFEYSSLLTPNSSLFEYSSLLTPNSSFKRIPGDLSPRFSWDLVFIDADKRCYNEYYDLVLPYVRSGGLIIADNTLWDGKVLDPNPKESDTQTRGLQAFNDRIAQDTRVEKVILPMRDGLTIIRKK